MSTDAARPGLRRSREKRMIAGVIGGMADRFDLNVTMLRVAYVKALSYAAGGAPGSPAQLAVATCRKNRAFSECATEVYTARRSAASRLA